LLANRETTPKKIEKWEIEMAKKEWTVMIYMAGDNDLSEEFIWSIKEIFRIGVSDKVAIVIEFDPQGKGNSRRYELAVSKANRAFNEDEDGIIERCRIDIKNPPTVSKRGKPLSYLVKRLGGFIGHSVKKFEANRYMLILAGHGSGAVGEVLMKDENPPGYLTITDLSNLIKAKSKLFKKKPEEKPIDILGFDSCDMSSLEVLFQVQDVANYFIGSEGFEDNAGWPFHRILQILKGKTDLETKDIACTIVEKHHNYYKDYEIAEISSDLAASDLSLCDDVATVIADLAKILKRKLKQEKSVQIPSVTNAIVLAHWRSQSYNFEEYVDLWDFCDLLENGCEDKSVQTACQKVKKAINNTTNLAGAKYDNTNKARPFVLKSCHTGAAFQYSNGVAIYFPWVRIEKDLKPYGKIDFAKKTDWHNFISDYVDLTQRPPRPGKGDIKLFREKISDFFGVQFADIRRIPSITRRQDPDTLGRSAIVPKVKNVPTDYYDHDCNCDE
jgi:hypothetical protein